MDVEEQIRRIFDNEISYNIADNSGIEDGYLFHRYNEKPRIGKIRNKGVGSNESKRGVHKFNRPHITSESESLAEENTRKKK
jgi:hypothetical protein